MTQGGSIELQVLINLQQIERDAKRAEALIEQALSDRFLYINRYICRGVPDPTLWGKFGGNHDLGLSRFPLGALLVSRCT